MAGYNPAGIGGGTRPRTGLCRGRTGLAMSSPSTGICRRSALVDSGARRIRRIAAIAICRRRCFSTSADRRSTSLRVIWPLAETLFAVDNRHGLAGHVGVVMNETAIRHLTRAAFAAHLANGFDLVRPALHIGFGQVAAGGVDRQLAVEGNPVLLHEPAGVAAFAIAVAFQGK